jgi:hypothetical protein
MSTNCPHNNYSALLFSFKSVPPSITLAAFFSSFRDIKKLRLKSFKKTNNFNGHFPKSAAGNQKRHCYSRNDNPDRVAAMDA